MRASYPDNLSTCCGLSLALKNSTLPCLVDDDRGVLTKWTKFARYDGRMPNPYEPPIEQKPAPATDQPKPSRKWLVWFVLGMFCFGLPTVTGSVHLTTFEMGSGATRSYNLTMPGFVRVILYALGTAFSVMALLALADQAKRFDDHGNSR